MSIFADITEWVVVRVREIDPTVMVAEETEEACHQVTFTNPDWENAASLPLTCPVDEPEEETSRPWRVLVRVASGEWFGRGMDLAVEIFATVFPEGEQRTLIDMSEPNSPENLATALKHYCRHPDDPKPAE